MLSSTLVDDDLARRAVAPASRLTEAASGAERRVVDAALRCIARWGLAKTTLDDIAREAACSRATVYRTFPGGKDTVVAAVVSAEIDRFLSSLETRLGQADGLEDLLVAAVTHAAGWLQGHDALQYLLRNEPEVVLPHVAFRHYDDVLATAVGIVSPWLVPHVGPAEAPRAAEWITRLTVSYAMSPGAGLDPTDDQSVRSVVRTYVLPGLRTTVQTPAPHPHEQE